MHDESTHGGRRKKIEGGGGDELISVWRNERERELSERDKY